MSKSAGGTGSTQNPALMPVGVLVGSWNMELYGAEFLPDPRTKVADVVTIEWIEGGAALVMRQGSAATWIIGRDDSQQEFRVLYADQRGISRVYDMSLTDDTWQMWRYTPEFSQRFHAKMSADHRTITGCWKKSFDGGTTWVHDFNMDYRRPAIGHDDGF